MVILQTNFGQITLKLDAEKAPKTVENFLNYVKSGFYDSTIFHRVINGFMIQGGGFTADMEQKSVQSPVENEANNGLPNKLGTIAMARTQDPHSATAQFFINVSDNDFLNHKNESMQGWGYCVFGEVVEGMDVVEKIKEVQTGNYGMHQDVPVEAVVIEKAEVASA
ncbi:peptidylprolyl isomerase [Paraferrimonas sedimenticola]|uniref:Peptidyl-prolyl cis-trans isomerase n=1 Tax=Paraferrimonas sedimenticola TaxID=375674 RepID=A0AA37VXH6_9GAMM|nr:peptidylprolyl isomerase [Paraferrimonas sedimenticola]GLP96564.1 peptidyl-prolyl cis-trans isomerase [Paraferrimonas sedimenticola]